MDTKRHNYSSSCQPSQHLNFDNFTSEMDMKSSPSMPSYPQPLGPEWTFDASTMHDFSSPPVQHRSLQGSLTEVIDPLDYCQRAGVIPDVDQFMSSSYLMSSQLDGLVSPSLMMPPSWHANTATAELGRATSLTHYGVVDPMAPAIDMSRLHSSSSLFSGHQSLDDALADSHLTNTRPLGHQTSLSEPSATMISPPQSSSINHHRSRSSIQSFSDQSSIFSPHTSMSRSLSTASSATTASDPSYQPTHSRKSSYKQKRSIAPKATDTVEPTGAANMVRIKSSNGSSREVGVLQRKQSIVSNRSQGLSKLTCDHCDEVPDGFRGEHELMRHFNLRHAPRRKAFVCVEPSGQEGFLAAVGCRSCKEGKIYGAYYNAAAHLRRVHFDPRPRGRKAKNQLERRGGKAGGNNPPMDILKANWIREVDVANTTSSQPQTDNEDEDETTIESTSHRQARGATGTSISSDGSEDDATLISRSPDSKLVPAFEMLHNNSPYPALSSTSTATSGILSPHDLTWQTTFAGDAAAAAWTDTSSSGMLLQHLSPQYDSLDNGFGYLSQHDSYLSNPWS